MAINFSFKLLTAFLALCEMKNFTRAAEHVHVSQSAFSGMIRRLEDEVGARLFDRDTRNVTLTPEGTLFEETARHLLHDIEWTIADLRDYVAKRKGRVGIATLPSIASDWMPPVIAEYRRLYPGIAIDFHDVLSDNCLELLQQGKVDLAVAAPGEPSEEYITEHFQTDRFFLICRRDHPIAARKSVSIADLRGCHFIRLARTTSVHQHIVSAVGSIGMTPSSFEVKYLSTVAGLILHGLGVSLLPELTLSQFRHPDLVAIPLAPPGISRAIHIIWRKDRPLSIAAQAMLDLIRQYRPQ